MLAGIANERVVKNLSGFLDFLPGIRLFRWAWGDSSPLENTRSLREARGTGFVSK